MADTSTTSLATWTPPPMPPSSADTIRRVADLLAARGLTIHGHPAYDQDGLDVDDAIRLACGEHANPEVIEAKIAQVGDLPGIYEAGRTTETVVGSLRDAADAWAATPEHRAEVAGLRGWHRQQVLGDGVETWTREWAAEHTQDLTDVTPEPWTVTVIPGSRVDVAKGVAQSPHPGDLGYRVRSVGWQDLVDAADAAYSSTRWQRCRGAVRGRLAELVADIATSLVEQPPLDPVGLVEVAARLGVARQTADNWRTGGVLPQPRWTVGGRPAWSWTRDLLPWAQATGRPVR